MAEIDWASAARAEALQDALREHAAELQHAGHAHEHPGSESVRRASHRGHEIEVRTTYRITVDGQPFPITASVDNAGRVHYHGLPTRDFPSTVDLVKDAIDTFPDDFGDHPEAPRPDHPHEQGQGQGHQHGHPPGHPRGHGDGATP